MTSDGGIHSHSKHLKAICDTIIENNVKHIYIHVFTDGRDCDPKSGIKHIKDFIGYAKDKNISIASIIGRYYAMDRDKRWDRTALAYNLLVNGEGRKTTNIIEAIEESYKNSITDEFITPIVSIDENNKTQEHVRYKFPDCKGRSCQGLILIHKRKSKRKKMNLEYFSLALIVKKKKNLLKKLKC